MIHRPRIYSAQEVVATARVLQIDEYDISDPRLDYFLEELSQAADDTVNEAAFLEWPDGSFGFAMLPETEPERCIALVHAYSKARAVLEWLVMEAFRMQDQPMQG